MDASIFLLGISSFSANFMILARQRLLDCDWRQHRSPRHLRVLAQSAPGIFVDHDYLWHAMLGPTLKFHLRHGELPADDNVVLCQAWSSPR